MSKGLDQTQEINEAPAQVSPETSVASQIGSEIASLRSQDTGTEQLPECQI